MSAGWLLRPLAWAAALAAAAAPWAFGAVDPRWSGLLSLTLLALGGAALLASAVRPASLPVARADAVALLLVVAAAAAGLLPLPHALRTWVAPAGASLLERAGAADTWRAASLAPQATIDALALAGAYCAAFLLLRGEASRPGGRRVLSAILVLSGVGLAVLGIAQDVTQRGDLQPKLYWRWQVYEAGTPYGPYVNRNHFAGAMAVLAGISVGEALGAWSARRRTVAALFGTATLVLLAGLAGTTSRGGALAAASGTAFLVASAPAGKRLRGLLIGVGVACAVGALLAWTGVLDTFLERMGTLYGRWRHRFAVQRDALAAFAGNPVLGTGAGTFEDVYPAFQRVADERVFQNAHSDWAQLAMETGLIGLAALGAAAARFGAWIRRGLAAQGAPRWHVLGPAAGAVAIAVHGLFDVNLHVPANALLTVCALSLASAASGAGATSAAGDADAPRAAAPDVAARRP